MCIILSCLILTVNISFGQDYYYFRNQLQYLQTRLQSIVNDERTIDDFEWKISEINQSVGNLQDEIDEFIEEQNLENIKEFTDLFQEIQEFHSFCGSLTCDCLIFFNKFLSILNGSSKLLKQKEGIKVFVSEVGNFKFYYAYSKQINLYSITVRLSDKNQTTNSYGSYNLGEYKFGMCGEIEIFRVATKNDNWTNIEIEVELKMAGDIQYNSRNCNDKFPRF